MANSVQLPPVPITPITNKTRWLLFRQKIGQLPGSLFDRLKNRLPAMRQGLANLWTRLRHASPLSILIGILSFVLAIQLFFGLNFLNQRFGLFRTPGWLTTLFAPKISYTFKNASKSTGYTLENQNRVNGFAMLLAQIDKPNVPSAKFTVETSSIGFALIDATGKTSYQRTTTNGRDQVTWTDALPDTDIVYTVVDDGLKEDIILKSNQTAIQLLKDRTRYQLFYDLTVTNAKPRVGIDGQYTPIFIDNLTGEYRFHIAPPTMVDAKG
ncbi:MAG: hypothetical protein WAV56_02680, partial [Microgenomates group bacterium]